MPGSPETVTLTVCPEDALETSEIELELSETHPPRSPRQMVEIAIPSFRFFITLSFLIVGCLMRTEKTGIDSERDHVPNLRHALPSFPSSRFVLGKKAAYQIFLSDMLFICQKFGVLKNRPALPLIHSCSCLLLYGFLYFVCVLWQSSGLKPL